MKWHQLDHMQTICTCCRQITTPTPHHSIFTGRMLFLTPNQQCRSTEGTSTSFFCEAKDETIATTPEILKNCWHDRHSYLCEAQPGSRGVTRLKAELPGRRSLMTVFHLSHDSTPLSVCYVTRQKCRARLSFSYIRRHGNLLLCRSLLCQLSTCRIDNW